jgi:hypothetical protein
VRLTGKIGEVPFHANVFCGTAGCVFRVFIEYGTIRRYPWALVSKTYKRKPACETALKRLLTALGATLDPQDGGA